MKVRRKPLIFEAEQYIPGEKRPSGVCDGLCGDWNCNSTTPSIHTLEGTMKISPEDWIIRGVDGEMWPCKPHIFQKTYEPLSPTETTKVDE